MVIQLFSSKSLKRFHFLCLVAHFAALLEIKTFSKTTTVGDFFLAVSLLILVIYTESSQSHCFRRAKKLLKKGLKLHTRGEVYLALEQYSTHTCRHCRSALIYFLSCLSRMLVILRAFSIAVSDFVSISHFHGLDLDLCNSNRNSKNDTVLGYIR